MWPPLRDFLQQLDGPCHLFDLKSHAFWRDFRVVDSNYLTVESHLVHVKPTGIGKIHLVAVQRGILVQPAADADRVVREPPAGVRVVPPRPTIVQPRLPRVLTALANIPIA